MFGAFIAVPVGWLAFGVLVLRELDESFADGYSAVVSLQNVWPRVDRRLFTVVVCGLATVGALALEHQQLRQLPAAARLGAGPADRGVPRRLLRHSAAAGLGRQRGRAGAAGDGGAVAARVRRLPADQPGLHRLVVPRLGLTSTGWLHFTVASWMSASLLSFAVAALRDRAASCSSAPAWRPGRSDARMTAAQPRPARTRLRPGRAGAARSSRPGSAAAAATATGG